MSKSNRGFASMSEEQHKAISSKGGKAIKPEWRGFSRDPKFAALCGAKGGKNVAPKNRSFSKDPALAAAAGKKGAKASNAAKLAKRLGAVGC